MSAEQQMWESRYAEAAASDSSVWSREPNRFVVEHLTNLAPGTGVDIACGEGRNALWLAERGWLMTGVDFASSALEVARRWGEEAQLQVDWVEADATEWTPEQPLDLVLLSYLHLVETSMSAVIQRAASWLNPGGVLFSIGHDRENLERGVGGPQDPAILHTAASLRSAASALRVERCEQVLRPVATEEGERHAIDTVLVAHRV